MLRKKIRLLVAIAGAIAVLVVTVILVKTLRAPAREGEGRVTLKSSAATVSFGAPGISKLPPWIPVYAGSHPEGIYSSDTGEETRNTYSFKTADPAAKVAAFFEDQLKANGFTVKPMPRGDAGGLVDGATANRKRTVMVTIAPANGVTRVGVMAVERKD
jgi:hypothetical protein